MTKVAVKYDKATKTIKSIVGVSIDTDMLLNIREGESLLEIPIKHPIINEQLNWEIKESANGVIELVRKPQDIIDKEETDRENTEARRRLISNIHEEALFNFLIQEFNVLRAKIKEPPLTKEQIQMGVGKIIQDKLKEI